MGINNIMPYRKDISFLAVKLKSMLFTRSTPYSIACFLAFFSIIYVNIWNEEPFYNWDLIPYTGVAYSYSESDATILHKRTYREIHQNVPDSTYDTLVNVSKHRRAVANNADNFVQHLPFYSVKPLYPSLMLIVSKFGIDLVSASVLISKTFYLLIGIILFWWILKYYPPISTLLIACLIMSTPFVMELGILSTPDAISSFMLLLVFFLYIEMSYIKTALVLLALSMTARPETAIIFAFLSIYIFILNKEDRLFTLAIISGALALYFTQTTLSESYGWKTLFSHSFIGFLHSPATQATHLSIYDYLNVLKSKSAPFELVDTSYSFVLFLLLNILALRLYSSGDHHKTKAYHALIVNLLYMCVHWVIFPSQKERLLAGSFIFIMVMLTIGVQKKNKITNVLH